MNKNLRLERVRVGNLFTRFNYDIDLANGYDISVLIAPNGCGKTTIFNLINFIFNPGAGYSRAINVPFDFCECTLSNGKIITLERRLTQNDAPKPDDEILSENMSLIKHIGDNAELTLTICGSDTINVTERVREALSSVDSDFLFMDEDDYEILDRDDLDWMELPPRVMAQYRGLSTVWTNISEYLQKNECDLKINFIRADRLHKRAVSAEPFYYSSYFRRQGKERPSMNPLSQIQVKTQRKYKEITDKYNDLQRDKKDQLPKLYLQTDDESVKMNFSEFEKRWKKYRCDLKKYADIGFPTSTKPILETDELDKAFKERPAFLTVYLEAFEETLIPLEEDYRHLKLFVDILNSRNEITRKVIKYGPEGIVVTVDGQPLSLECLSSGEKNDLIMFYNLIFGSENNGLVLVDEPEISLHIKWQEEYLDFLLEICDMNNLQAVVATHSPNIVSGHSELYAARGLVDGY